MQNMKNQALLLRMNDVVHQNFVAKILHRVLSEWPVYDLATIDALDQYQLGAHIESKVLIQVLRRVGALMELMEAGGKSPLHLGDESYDGENLIILASALAESPFYEDANGSLRIDEAKFHANLKRRGVKWSNATNNVIQTCH